jgi:endonuclease/exonuclease/phosphatase family metal-dependent hydrolase
MRIVTWNMGCGPSGSRYRKTHESAWRYLLDELHPDVALVQEALLDVPETARGRGAVVSHEHVPNADVGTAVFVSESLRGATRGFRVVAPENSYLAGAELGSDGHAFVVISAHVYPDEHHQRSLEAVRDALCAALAGKAGVVGGDFNAARSFKGYHTRFFDDMAAGGFYDCHWGKNGCEKRTFWTRGDVQDDHLFVSAEWSSRVGSCQVLDNAEVRALSDHGPVVLDLDLAGIASLDS